jgi:hypothetical protein
MTPPRLPGVPRGFTTRPPERGGEHAARITLPSATSTVARSTFAHVATLYGGRLFDAGDRWTIFAFPSSGLAERYKKAVLYLWESSEQGGIAVEVAPL